MAYIEGVEEEADSVYSGVRRKWKASGAESSWAAGNEVFAARSWSRVVGYRLCLAALGRRRELTWHRQPV